MLEKRFGIRKGRTSQFLKEEKVYLSGRGAPEVWESDSRLTTDVKTIRYLVKKMLVDNPI